MLRYLVNLMKRIIIVIFVLFIAIFTMIGIMIGEFEILGVVGAVAIVMCIVFELIVYIPEKIYEKHLIKGFKNQLATNKEDESEVGYLQIKNNSLFQDVHLNFIECPSENSKARVSKFGKQTYCLKKGIYKVEANVYSYSYIEYSKIVMSKGRKNEKVLKFDIEPNKFYELNYNKKENNFTFTEKTFTEDLKKTSEIFLKK